MIFKILVFIIVLILIYYIFFKKNNTKKDNNSMYNHEEIMVECEYCKTFISINEAIKKNNHIYCSNKCLKDSR